MRVCFDMMKKFDRNKSLASKNVSTMPRVVPAFSYQSVQKNTIVQNPPKSDALKLIASKSTISPKTNFQIAYQRNDLPVQIDHGGTYPRIKWKVSFDEIDYDRWLPIFIGGLMDTTFPCCFLAERGSLDLIENGKTKVLSSLPFCIIPLKDVLHSKQPVLMNVGMKVLQKIATDVEFGGEALVPYYRQLLPPLGMFKNKNVNIGDRVEFGQRKHTNLGDMIEETLQVLEKHGGSDSFINIQYIIPTYQSNFGKR